MKENKQYMKNKVTIILIFTAFIAFCFSCNHPTNPDVAVDRNKNEDTIVTPVPQALTRDFRRDVIISLYMMGCNDRLEMGLPADHTEDYWNFLVKVDSLVEAPNYFERIESNLDKDPYGEYLQDSLQRWLFFDRIFFFPTDCDLDLFECGVTDEIPQTHHVLDKYIDRTIQCSGSLSISQLDFYRFDVINYLISLPCEEQLKYIIDYYSYIRDHPIDWD